MGKIKQKAKSRSHIAAVKIDDGTEKDTLKEFTLIKPSNFSLADNESDTMKSKKVCILFMYICV